MNLIRYSMIKMTKNKNYVYRDGKAEEKFDAWHYLQWITGTNAGMKNQIIIYNKFWIALISILLLFITII